MNERKRACLAGVFVLFLTMTIFCRESAFGVEGSPDEIGVTERLGQTVPLDLTFYDESGSAVKLGEVIDKPTVLTLVYYHCSHICPQMLLGLSEVFSKLEMTPGKDYGAITLSFDDTDTPEDARSQKVNYIKAINSPFPEDSWKFLTADRQTIRRMADSVGITFMRVIHGFVHPEVAVFLSPQGRITSYLYISKVSYGVGYPINFSSIDFTRALSDASKGITREGAKTAPLLCFPHEPEQQGRFFRILWIVGAITLFLMVSFFAYLNLTSRKSKR